MQQGVSDWGLAAGWWHRKAAAWRLLMSVETGEDVVGKGTKMSGYMQGPRGVKRFVFSYFRLGEKFGEEVPPAGKQHVSQSVFIELIGVDAVC